MSEGQNIQFLHSGPLSILLVHSWLLPERVSDSEGDTVGAYEGGVGHSEVEGCTVML
jgi:hypothetical protein